MTHYTKRYFIAKCKIINILTFIETFFIHNEYLTKYKSNFLHFTICYH